MTRQRPFGILAAAAASAPGWLTSAGLTRLVTAAAFAGAVAFMGAPALVAGEIVNHVQIDGDLLDPEGGTLAGTTSDGELDWGVTAGSDTMADTGTDCIIDEEANAFSPTPGICQGQTDSVLIIDLAKGEGATDNIFDKGSKEDCPVAEVDGGPLGCTKGWTFKLGQPPSGKTDLTVVGAWKDQADSPFVDLNLDGMADTYV